jgi:hypothetical protein
MPHRVVVLENRQGLLKDFFLKFCFFPNHPSNKKSKIRNQKSRNLEISKISKVHEAAMLHAACRGDKFKRRA